MRLFEFTHQSVKAPFAYSFGNCACCRSCRDRLLRAPVLFEPRTSFNFSCIKSRHYSSEAHIRYSTYRTRGLSTFFRSSQCLQLCVFRRECSFHVLYGSSRTHGPLTLSTTFQVIDIMFWYFIQEWRAVQLSDGRHCFSQSITLDIFKLRSHSLRFREKENPHTSTYNIQSWKLVWAITQQSHTVSCISFFWHTGMAKPVNRWRRLQWFRGLHASGANGTKVVITTGQGQWTLLRLI